MPVKIRLKRLGAIKHPVYRLVVANSTNARDGRFIDTIGHYDPHTDPASVTLDHVKALHWLHHGAQPSDTARAILKKAGVMAQLESDKAAAREQRKSEKSAG